MKATNEDIRLCAKRYDVRLWQIAEALEISECTFSKRLRHELPEDQKEVIYETIRELSSAGETK